MTKKLLCPKEVAAKIGVTVQTLATWRSSIDPKFPYIPYCKMGRSVRYTEEDIDNFIYNRTKKKKRK